MANDPSPLKWIFEIYDKMSGPAKQIATSLGTVDKALDKATISTKKLESVGGDSLAKFAGKFALIFEAVHIAVDAIGSLISKTAELGVEFYRSAVEAAGFEQQSRIAFEVLTGSAKAANETLEETKRFALDAALPLQTVEQAYRNLLLGGVRKENIGLVLSASADIANLQGTGASGAAAISQVFADIKSKGQLTGRNLLAFQGAVDFDVLAAKLGHAGVGFRGLQKILSEAPVSADAGIVGILQAISEKTGAVGSTTQKFAETIPGIIQRVKTGWDEILGQLADSPAFETLRQSLSRLARYFDPFTAEGKKTGDLVAKILTQMTGLIDELIANPDAISNLFDNAYTTANKLLDVVGPIAKLLGYSSDVALHPIESVKEAFTHKALNAANAAADELSPDLSAQMQSTGADYAKIAGGYPAHGTGGHFSTPHLAIVGDKPEWIIPDSQVRRGGGAGGVIINISQNISVSGGSAKDAEDTGHIIARVSQADLQSALEGMALSLGLA